MRIKMLTSIAGLNYSHRPGEVVEWRDAKEAARLVKAGLAVPVKGELVEVSDAPRAPETAAAPIVVPPHTVVAPEVGAAGGGSSQPPPAATASATPPADAGKGKGGKGGKAK